MGPLFPTPYLWYTYIVQETSKKHLKQEKPGTETQVVKREQHRGHISIVLNQTPERQTFADTDPLKIFAVLLRAGSPHWSQQHSMTDNRRSDQDLLVVGVL